MRRVADLVGTVVLVGTLIATLAACRAAPRDETAAAGATPSPMPSPAPAARAALPPPAFVGMAACVECHAPEAEAWRGSQHAAAIQPATAGTVLGDFSGTSFKYGAVTSRFSTKDGRYVVRTDGPDGKLADFTVSFTFGVYPLQQYLIDFPDGRKQALSIAWDARPKAQGGQRWFHLYPNETIDSRDPLHWTRAEQNWNFMCADCHSTNLRRNYDAPADRYATTWSDLNVACEACHGPASNHVAWAEHRPGTEAWPSHGLAIALDERGGVQWAPAASGSPARSRPLASHREVETCAVCHARRRPIGVEPGPTGALLDTHVPALLDAPLYEADGQQHDEVYTYGSFLQSKMYARGVTCSDCHEPHGGTLRAPGNAVCAQCHAATTYDAPTHHRHAEGGAGAQCVACHMPTRTYMQVDPRHDHSLRIPRPDLTVSDGVPNACNGCHADRDAAWAAAASGWWGPERTGFQTFVTALRAGRDGAPGAAQGLAALVTNAAAPDIARATAAAMLETRASAATLPAIQAALIDASPLVRAAGLDAVRGLPPDVRGAVAAALAGDPVKAVRVKAGRALAGLPPSLLDTLPPARAVASRDAVAAFVASERAVAERPESHLNLGIAAAERGDAAAAEVEYRAALARDPGFVPAYANLADLQRAAGRDGEAAKVLADGLAAVPDDPSLLHALGLQRVREHRNDEALALLRRAAAGRPADARFAYVYGVALHSAGRVDEATTVLTGALARTPYDPSLLAALAAFARDAGDRETALGYARRLAAVAPDDEGVTGLLRQLGGE